MDTSQYSRRKVNLKKKNNLIIVIIIRYKYLADKERLFLDQLQKVNREMVNLTSAMLDDNCNSMDETMKSVYKTDYAKRGKEWSNERIRGSVQIIQFDEIWISGLPIKEYRQLKAAVDSAYCSPFPEEATEIKEGYRDPTRFRYTAIERPHIQPAKTITFCQGIRYFRTYLRFFYISSSTWKIRWKRIYSSRIVLCMGNTFHRSFGIYGYV